MKQGLLKCKELKILGYGFAVLFLCACVRNNSLSSLRGTSLTGESGAHLNEIFASLQKLDTVE